MRNVARNVQPIAIAINRKPAFARLGWLTLALFALKGLVYLGAAAVSLRMMW